MEKTWVYRRRFRWSWKHLHGRGEDWPARSPCGPARETPPRTWRRPAHRDNRVEASGNTSTDVEKTWAKKHHSSAVSRNTSTDVEKTICSTDDRTQLEKPHHGRGEDVNVQSSTLISSETPPRTWRRPLGDWLEKRHHRNTSTDVEKTLRQRPIVGRL